MASIPAMPALKNQRQERFCQLLKRGIPAYRAYPLAGYKPHESAPYRLCGNVRIKKRVRELTRHIAMKTRVTIESLTEEFNEAIELAKRVENPNAITAAAIAKGKLHGLMVDRKETGGPGDFASASTADDVLELVRKELGDDTADALAAALSKREAEPEAAQLPELDAERDDGATLN